MILESGIAYIVKLHKTGCCNRYIQNKQRWLVLVSETIYLIEFLSSFSWLTCVFLALYLKFWLWFRITLLVHFSFFLNASKFFDNYFVHFPVIQYYLLDNLYYSSTFTLRFFNIMDSFKYLFSRLCGQNGRHTGTPHLSAASPSPSCGEARTRGGAKVEWRRGARCYGWVERNCKVRNIPKWINWIK